MQSKSLGKYSKSVLLAVAVLSATVSFGIAPLASRFSGGEKPVFLPGSSSNHRLTLGELNTCRRDILRSLQRLRGLEIIHCQRACLRALSDEEVWNL